MRKNRAPYLALIAANALWGTSFLFGKIALRELAASHVIVGRFLLATLLLLPLLLRRRPGLRRADLPHFALAGVLMVPVMMLLQFEGLARTSASRAALIVGTLPVLMALAAVLFGRERLTARGWTAVAISTFGAFWLVGAPGAAGGLLGPALVFGSLLAAAAWVLVTRPLLHRYGALTSTVLSMGVGALVLLPVALWRDGLPPASLGLDTWGALAGLGVGCTALTYVLWNWGLQHVPPARAGVFVNLEPLVGALLGIWLLGDRPHAGLLLGGACILAAALLVTREPGPEGGAVSLAME